MSTFFAGKTVLVTGAAGFIGSHLVERLLAEGATVIGVDNFLTGRQANIDFLSDLPTAQGFRFRFTAADVTQDPANYLNSAKPDVVLHFASPASPPRYQAHPVETYLVNSLATHLLLNYLRQHSPQARFVFASTSEVYGDPAVHPQPESYWGNVNPNGPRSCYDESKRLGETICGVHARDFGMDVRIVRIFNTYGPRMDPADGRVIPQFIGESLAGQPYSIYGDGSQTRSYCYVSDLVEGIVRLAGTEGLEGETVNLGNPQELTVLETAEAIHRVAGNAGEPQFERHPLPQDDPKQRRPDISKAKELLGWQPQVGLEDGLRQTLDYFRQLPQE